MRRSPLPQRISGPRLTVIGACRITGLDENGKPIGPIVLTAATSLDISLSVASAGVLVTILTEERDKARAEVVALERRLRALEDEYL